MNTMLLVYITTPSPESAASIAHHLLEKKLIACANIHVSTSMYWWDSAIQTSQEAIIIAKSFEHFFAELEKEVISIHPYKVPCILKITAQATEPFTTWMQETIKKL